MKWVPALKDSFLIRKQCFIKNTKKKKFLSLEAKGKGFTLIFPVAGKQAFLGSVAQYYVYSFILFSLIYYLSIFLLF